MRFIKCLIVCTLVLVSVARAREPVLTIHTQDFAVVRETVHLDLKAGINEVKTTEVTAHMEPQTVLLKDPAGQRLLRILEQNYHPDAISQELLLPLFVGKTLDFQVDRQGEPSEIVRGKLLRAPYVLHEAGLRRFNQEYAQVQQARAQPGWWGRTSNSPIVEVNGSIRFGLPGAPIFTSLPDAANLAPELLWRIETDRDGPIDAELSYLSGGLGWEADYNVVSEEGSELLDITAWVTIDNQCGRSFENASVKLVAGKASRLQEEQRRGGAVPRPMPMPLGPTALTSTFDEYHLYSLKERIKVRDRETKQVELLRVGGVPSQRLYVYDGVRIDQEQYRYQDSEGSRRNQQYGTDYNPKIWVFRELENTSAHQLGFALPSGRMRFYRRGQDRQLEFIGENRIDHIPANASFRLFTGDAFDLVGQRQQTDFQSDRQEQITKESFEIRIANQKNEAVEVRVVEHLYRWHDWTIIDPSQEFEKKDSRTIEFRLQIPAGDERLVKYTVRYEW